MLIHDYLNPFLLHFIRITEMAGGDREFENFIRITEMAISLKARLPRLTEINKLSTEYVYVRT